MTKRPNENASPSRVRKGNEIMAVALASTGAEKLDLKALREGEMLLTGDKRMGGWR